MGGCFCHSDGVTHRSACKWRCVVVCSVVIAARDAAWCALRDKSNTCGVATWGGEGLRVVRYMLVCRGGALGAVWCVDRCVVCRSLSSAGSSASSSRGTVRPTLARIRGNKYRTCARCRRKKFFCPPLGGQDSSQNGLFRHDAGNRAMIFASGGQGGKPSGPPANQSTGGKGYAGQGHERSRASRAQGGIAQG